jgi:catechol 2,3-dioxygenase-like lactoylglutathione lyase family enzyme
MEVAMSTTQVSSDTATEATGAAPVPLRLEVVTLPVSDVDRAKAFYLSLGWRLDADISAGDDFRVVQVTPPQSQASVHFGKGLTTAKPGSLDRLYLAVTDIDAARADLISRGASVSEVYHYERGPGHSGEFDSRVNGPDREHPYSTYASFDDPDGNGWLLQEITSRLPGREWED